MAQVDTWARHIRKQEDYLEVPADFRAVFETDTGAGCNPEIYLIYCPASERLRKMMSEKLLYIYDCSLICLERERDGLTRRQFRVENISLLESGYVLLDSWTTIAGLNGREHEMITIHYNRVVALFFEKLVELLRIMALDLKYPPVFNNSISISLQKTSYKYMNYTRNIIFDDQSLIGHIYQRPIFGRRFKILRRALTNDHIMILTKSELILVTTGKGVADRYGRTNTFFSRRFIDRPEYSEDEATGHLRLTLSSRLYHRSLLFDGKNLPGVLKLISRLGN